MHSLLQHIAPQRTLTALAGWLAECRWPWLKKILINYFLSKYAVDLDAAVISNKEDYPTFNSLFTRHLKPGLRPIAGQHQIASPVDGCISQIGYINRGMVFQAKGFHFSLQNLLGGDSKTAKLFEDGAFATLYLAPKDYHRVHMPLSGSLKESTFIPGKLFSVNHQTARSVENLFARNERLVCLFETELGPMVIILVGAMLVGSINTVWEENIFSPGIKKQTHENIYLKKGDELGHFKMGSTAIILLPKDKVQWLQSLREESCLLMGESLGNLHL